MKPNKEQKALLDAADNAMDAVDASRVTVAGSGKRECNALLVTAMYVPIERLAQTLIVTEAYVEGVENMPDMSTIVDVEPIH